MVASIPPKSAPAEYTGFFVENAISRYQTQGLDTTLAYYNREESIDGQWYVFVIDENDLVIGHPDAHRLGLDLKGWVGTDANGYNFGPDMLSATEDGKWVSYVYRNPESGGIGADHTGALEYKHVWVVRHDGLLFASGWHISADEYTQFVVDEAIARYHAEGLDSTLAYYNNPDSVDAQWYVFVATPDGEILGHYNADDLGSHLEEMLEDGSFRATEEGLGDPRGCEPRHGRGRGQALLARRARRAGVRLRLAPRRVRLIHRAKTRQGTEGTSTGMAKMSLT